MTDDYIFSYPEPINYSIFKHHADFIMYYIDSKSHGNDTYENIAGELKYIGHSLIDLYCGSLTPSEISEEIINILENESSLTFSRYKNYLEAEGSDYRTVKLSDDSIWVLRLGTTHDRFVHIHPGKYSPETTRVRALTLKSAILFIIYTNRERDAFFDLHTLNHIRTEYLKVSPQKKFSPDYGVGRIVFMLKRTH